MIAYLAHPIDFNPDVEDGLLNRVVADLVKRGFVVYDPAEAVRMSRNTPPGPEVSRINQAAMDQASVFVIVSPESETIGTVLELAYAARSGKPTVVVSKAVDRSWSLAGLEDYSHVLLVPDWGTDDVDWLWDLHQATPAVLTRTFLKYSFNDEAGPDAVASAFYPSRKYEGDAGFDLYVTQDIEIPVGKFADIPCGINVELPENTWGLIIGRSSTLRTHNLMVATGVIDHGYRGPLYAGVYNMNGSQFSAKRGMRLAQFIPFPLTAKDMVPHWVPSLAESDRGTRGFGSTGV